MDSTVPLSFAKPANVEKMHEASKNIYNTVYLFKLNNLSISFLPTFNNQVLTFWFGCHCSMLKKESASSGLSKCLNFSLH